MTKRTLPRGGFLADESERYAAPVSPIIDHDHSLRANLAAARDHIQCANLVLDCDETEELPTSERLADAIGDLRNAIVYMERMMIDAR